MRRSLLPWTAAILLLLVLASGVVAASTRTVVLAVEGMTCGA